MSQRGVRERRTRSSLEQARSSQFRCLISAWWDISPSMKNRYYDCTVRWLLLLFLFLWLVSGAQGQATPDAGWPNYGNDAGGTRYSNASQMDRSNVTKLKVAWTYRTGAFPHDAE